MVSHVKHAKAHPNKKASHIVSLQWLGFNINDKLDRRILQHTLNQVNKNPESVTVKQTRMNYNSSNNARGNHGGHDRFHGGFHNEFHREFGHRNFGHRNRHWRDGAWWWGDPFIEEWYSEDEYLRMKTEEEEPLLDDDDN